ncbi:MAG: hypothetical protein IJY25_02715 [Bacilli bacterium]|nr:hypothetical protein [Bacilli bacterium]
MKKTRNVLWGLVFIVIGLVFGLNALDITHINIFFDGWWTLIIIIPCFIDLFKGEGKTGNIIGILVGVVLLLCSQGILDFSLVFKLILPVILVIIGISFIFKDTINKKVRDEMKKLNKKNEDEYCATFGGQKLDFSNEEFKGCNINAIFGGIDCDLKDSIVNEDVIINVSAIFGGVDIIVPKDVKVKVTSTPVFGGVSNERKNPKDDKIKTIYVNAICIFGGVEIK